MKNLLKIVILYMFFGFLAFYHVIPTGKECIGYGYQFKCQKISFGLSIVHIGDSLSNKMKVGPFRLPLWEVLWVNFQFSMHNLIIDIQVYFDVKSMLFE